MKSQSLVEDEPVFAHPGAFGSMGIPASAVRDGFFKRRRPRGKSIDSNESDHASGAALAPAATVTTSPHPLCGTPNGVDELVAEARASADAERRARAEEKKLQDKRDALDGEIQRLQRDKQDRTEAHRQELSRLRAKLETDARESKRRLKEELEKGHAESVELLIRQMDADKERLNVSTRKLREQEQRAYEARVENEAAAAAAATTRRTASAAASAIGKEKEKKSIFGRRGVDDSSSSAAGAVTSTSADGDKGASTGDVPFMPQSPGFWRGLSETFSPRDLLGGAKGGAAHGHGRGGSGGGGSVGTGSEGDSLAPPALLVLAAVPLFCLYRRWKFNRG